MTHDFPLKFPLWLISFETRSRDILKYIAIIPTSTLFFVPRPLILFRSNDNRILVIVVNILFIFSLMRVMRDSLRKIGVMRNW